MKSRHVSLGKEGVWMKPVREGSSRAALTMAGKSQGTTKAKHSIREPCVQGFAWQLKETRGPKIGATFT